MSAKKQPVAGDAVIYCDPFGRDHNALCTTDWGGCINVLYLSDDAACKDQYGRQSLHESSVQHVSDVTVHGRYWRWADEARNEYKAPVSV